jgi:hypothetical protein
VLLKGDVLGLEEPEAFRSKLFQLDNHVILISKNTGP